MRAKGWWLWVLNDSNTADYSCGGSWLNYSRCTRPQMRPAPSILLYLLFGLPGLAPLLLNSLFSRLDRRARPSGPARGVEAALTFPTVNRVLMGWWGEPAWRFNSHFWWFVRPEQDEPGEAASRGLHCRTGAPGSAGAGESAAAPAGALRIPHRDFSYEIYIHPAGTWRLEGLLPLLVELPC
jgi:hypothetical protein